MAFEADEQEVYLEARKLLFNCPSTMLTAIRNGLAVGKGQYGALDTATDDRDYCVEASQELRDALVYVCAEIVRNNADSKPNDTMIKAGKLIVEAWLVLGGKV